MATAVGAFISGLFVGACVGTLAMIVIVAGDDDRDGGCHG